MALLGAHMSVAGGLHLAFSRITQVGGQALQIFTRNQRQWRAAPISAEEQRLFQAAWRQWGNWPVAAHNSYLINLASPDQEVRGRSVTALAAELERCAALSIPLLIMHPGSHGGDGAAVGLERLVEHLDQALARAAGAEQVDLLLENTAGQGNDLGATFAEIAYVLNHAAHSSRLGVCLDTCHLFAAGYDFRTSKSYRQTMDEFDRLIGLDRLRFFHLNDSIKGLGSRVDRHEHIGRGRIGLTGFRNFLRDPRFRHQPMTLETPKGKDLKEDMVNLQVLRKLQGKAVRSEK
ncbi:MAG: deoxyribonuclease IV [Desulfurivibrio sp.]|nr:MAG: deoxyribonuclease IV [Desulfurivibrio sp.]